VEPSLCVAHLTPVDGAPTGPQPVPGPGSDDPPLR
jgi:hypothetical protein